MQLNGECWQDEERGLFVPTHRRALGFVFQEASLFPHLTVRQNLEYGWRRVPPERRQIPLGDQLKMVQHRLHGRVQAVAVGQLEGQAFA